MLDNLLRERDILPVLTHADGTAVTAERWEARREEMLRALETYSYGVTPRLPVTVRGAVTVQNERAFANKAVQEKVDITITTEEYGEFTFPMWLFIPKYVEKPPVLLHIAFRFDEKPSAPPIWRQPVEEILDRGYALVSLPYDDILNDRLNGDFSDGIAAYFGVTKENRDPDTWGKIGMWSYACSRVMDYLVTRDDLDHAHTTIIGHSRLGKTALWTGAQDTRFWCTISNNSGYAGAATSKGIAEDSEHAWHFGSHYNGNWDWCCNTFMDYVDREDEKPYDQSWLLACCAPRLLYVGSAVEDRWADPAGEFMATLWASQAWELLGKTGLVTPDSMPEAGDVRNAGDVGYHLRRGSHFLSREDWNYYLDFLDRHLGRK